MVTRTTMTSSSRSIGTAHDCGDNSCNNDNINRGSVVLVTSGSVKETNDDDDNYDDSNDENVKKETQQSLTSASTSSTLLEVRGDSCQTIDMSSPLLEENPFGSVESNDDHKDAQLKEVSQVVSSKISSSSLNDYYGSSGEYDICREYGYKYEFDYHDSCRDRQQQQQQEQNGFGANDDDDDHEDVLSSKIPALPLNLSFLSNIGSDIISRNNNICRNENDNNNNNLSSSGLVADEYEEEGKSSSSADTTTTIYLLGKSYHPVNDYTIRRSDESSLFWFTYRCDFPEIVPYRICTDAGWGCMLRSAQMLLGQTLRLHYRDRNWRSPQFLGERRTDPFIQKILTWFADYPSQTKCRYSLHNMVAVGMSKYETLPGEWYGPGTACYVIRDLCKIHEHDDDDDDNSNKNIHSNKHNQLKDRQKKGNMNRPMFRVYVASQGTVYRDAVDDLMVKKVNVVDNDVTTNDTAKFKENEASTNDDDNSNDVSHPLDPKYDEEKAKVETQQPWDTALLILIPLRLGLKTFNAESYAESLAHIFSFRQSVGVLGGRPRGARWFYGASSDGSKLLGLDPHTVQDSPRRIKDNSSGVRGKSTIALTDEYIRSVHCSNPEVINLHRMDPSLALGFYCRDRDDFQHLCKSLKLWKEASSSSMPDLFTVADAVPDYSANVSSVMNEMLLSTMSSTTTDREGLNIDNLTGSSLFAADDDGNISDDEDEYVML